MMNYIKIPGIDIFYGQELKTHISYSLALERRDFVPRIIETVTQRKRLPLLVAGLRRTGKTVMLEQALGGLPLSDFARAVLITISTTVQVDINDLTFIIEELISNNFKHFFIDEITNVNNFIDRCQVFADNYCKHGCTFVLSGTNSLTFKIAENSNMLGRREAINTTIIIYGEWSRVLYNKSKSLPDISDFLMRGGILDSQGIPLDTALLFKNIKRQEVNFGNENYVNSSIALNIQNSLIKNKNSNEYKILAELLEYNTLTNAISRIVENQNHSAALEIFNSIFSSHDLSDILIKTENQKEERKILYMNKEKILSDIKVHLGIEENIDKITKQQVQQLIAFLEKIQFFAKEIVYIIDEGYLNFKEQYILTQPGIRTEQITSTYQTVVECLWAKLKDFDQEKFKSIWLSTILGKVLEEWIRVELILAFPYYDIAKISWKDQSCEFDIIMTKNSEVHLIEVKFSSNFKTDYAKNFRNEEKLNFVKNHFGEILSKRVLYLGEDCVSEDCPYQNIEHFLNRLYLNCNSFMDDYQDLLFKHSQK